MKDFFEKITIAFGMLLLLIGLLCAIYFYYMLLCEPIILIGVILFIIAIISFKQSNIEIWKPECENTRNKIKEFFGHFACWLILCFVIGAIIVYNFGSKDVKSPFAKGEFDFNGYVYAFPDSRNDKNYRLVADMTKNDGYYQVNRIYFSNGGHIDFEDCEGGNKDGEAFFCTPINDDSERDWCFIFYGDMVKDKK